jgi:molybdate transport system regulatory protein
VIFSGDLLFSHDLYYKTWLTAMMRSVLIKIQIPYGKYVAFGPGKADLLDAIGRHGSISAAAKSMGMSYKRAWELVSVMNSSFKQPVVITLVGGSHGGGATLTEFGSQVLNMYREIVAKSEQFVASETDAFLAMLAPVINPDLSA